MGAVRPVTDEERYKSIRANVKNAAEIVATFEAAYEDKIPLDNERALEMLYEASASLSLAFSDASASEHEVDGLGI